MADQAPLLQATGDEGVQLKHLERFLTKIRTVFATKAEVPSKTSDLTNDSGFLTEAGVARTWNDLPN